MTTLRRQLEGLQDYMRELIVIEARLAEESTDAALEWLHRGQVAGYRIVLTRLDAILHPPGRTKIATAEHAENAEKGN